MTGTHIDGPGAPVLHREDYAEPRHFTHSGRWVNPLDPAPEDIVIVDIAYGLANQSRFYGQHGRLSVAQHSVIVAACVPEDLSLPALLHDSPEYLLGDMSHPIKYGSALGAEYRKVEAHVAAKIEAAFGFAPGIFSNPAIKAADDMTFEAEWRAYVTEEGEYEVWDEDESLRSFLEAYEAFTS